MNHYFRRSAIALFLGQLCLPACGGESSDDSNNGQTSVGGQPAAGGADAAAPSTGGQGGPAASTGGQGGMDPGTGGDVGTGGSGAGGGCDYKSIPGTAEILQIEASTEGCAEDSSRVRYKFQAQDATIPPESYDPTKFGFNETFETLTLQKGSSTVFPPTSCLAPSGIKVGAKLVAVRQTILSGACAPVVDEFPQFDPTLCLQECTR